VTSCPSSRSPAKATGSQRAAGKYDPSDEAAGWWDGLIGPGKAIDTNRYFVVASNMRGSSYALTRTAAMLMRGSSYGSTAPASLNPKTGRRYGPDFPDITLRDIVNMTSRRFAPGSSMYSRARTSSSRPRWRPASWTS
jgi:homoserine O-acetyltransferase